MSALVLQPTSVTPMRGVQTLKVLTAVAVSRALKGMANTAQVKIKWYPNISGKSRLSISCSWGLKSSESNLRLLKRYYDSIGYWKTYKWFSSGLLCDETLRTRKRGSLCPEKGA